MTLLAALGVFALGALSALAIVRVFDWIDQPDKPAPRELGAEGYGYGESL
jgi:hypothetical protein